MIKGGIISKTHNLIGRGIDNFMKKLEYKREKRIYYQVCRVETLKYICERRKGQSLLELATSLVKKNGMFAMCVWLARLDKYKTLRAGS